jgi:hypothetical protein
MARLDALPDEVLTLCVSKLSAHELCALACVSRRYRVAARSDDLWRALYAQAFVTAAPLAARAARLAGSWAALYADAEASAKRAAPWCVPCTFELHAQVDALLGGAAEGALTRTAGVPAEADRADADDVHDARARVDGPPTPPGAAGAGDAARLALLFLVDGRCAPPPGVLRGSAQHADNTS